MTIVAGLLIAAMSLLLASLCRMSRRMRKLCDSLAAIGFFVMFTVISAAVARTIWNGTVFMTEVHSILVNPFLLVSGAFVGAYTVAKLIEAVFSERN